MIFGRKVLNSRGAVLVFVAVSLVVLLGIGGLALDSGRGFLEKARLARAVDAGVLAAARALRQGEDVARQRAIELAQANGAASGAGPSSLDVTFGLNEFGEQTVQLVAMRQIPTALMRVLGIDSMTVRAAAVAAVPPVDLVLVLDQSESLVIADAFDDLQDAAKLFVANFDDDLDQLGLVSFQFIATDRFALASDFTAPIGNSIDQMTSFGYTNISEGLRLAREQITGPAARERSAKVVVFFTDGRPTAFRENLNGQDRVLALHQTGSRYKGYYNNPDQLPINAPAANANGCQNSSWCLGYWQPNARQHARQLGLDRATEIRTAGIFVYSIGLGNPNLSNPLWQPDMDYLRQIANEDGIADPGQPTGKAYFAPSAAELRAVFELVASDLLVRLAQ